MTTSTRSLRDSALLLALISVAPTFGSATLLAQPTPRRIEINGALPPMKGRELVTLDPATVDATKLVAISAAPDGSIVVADPSQYHLIAFSPDGKARRTLGRKGHGPGEFISISSLGWVGDTLVTASYSPGGSPINYFDFRSGKPVGTVAAVSWLKTILLAGRVPWAVTDFRGAVSFALLSTSGPSRSTIVMPGWVSPERGWDCESKDGWVAILDHFTNPDHGLLNALVSGPRLVAADREGFTLQISGSDGQRTTLSRAVKPVPLNDAMWDSLHAEIRAVEAKRGSLSCGRPIDRPATVNVVRAIASDEFDRIWVEVTEAAGEMIYVVTPNGVPVGSFRLPSGGDIEVPWFVRGDKLYQVTVDADGLHGIRVFSITK